MRCQLPVLAFLASCALARALPRPAPEAPPLQLQPSPTRTGIADDSSRLPAADRHLFDLRDAAPLPTLHARQEESPAPEDPKGKENEKPSAPTGSPSPSPSQQDGGADSKTGTDKSTPAPSDKQDSPSQTRQRETPTSEPSDKAAAGDDGLEVERIDHPKKNELPLKPTITPGMGVGGVILLGAGLAFTLIGTKNKWIHVFFSVAFLASIAVTVLIVYLYHPPISPALEGGFLVAAVVTGVIFGALSNIFSEVTEGLGCLLGGFCLSMWFLCLREGGLIHPQFGRIILIAVLGLSVYALSFSSKTRSYASLASAAFAGATATVLGIDCFSRAGLKEFWLYLWNLNPDLFPLETSTYPLTRGIRVELAGIILLFVLGLISQFKLWRLVKERRARKNAARIQEEEDLERLESDLGRQIQGEVEAEKLAWEEKYNNVPGTGSSNDTDRPRDGRPSGENSTLDEPDRKSDDGQAENDGGQARKRSGSLQEQVEAEAGEGRKEEEESGDLTELPIPVTVKHKKKRKSRKSSNLPASAKGSRQGDQQDDSKSQKSGAAAQSDSDSSSGSDSDSDSESNLSSGSSHGSKTKNNRGGIPKAVGVKEKTADDDDSSVAATIEGSNEASDRSSLSEFKDESDGAKAAKEKEPAEETAEKADPEKAEAADVDMAADTTNIDPSAVLPAADVGEKPKPKKNKTKRARRAKSVQVEADEVAPEEEAAPTPLKAENLGTDKVSKAWRIFRTNEWAKHLDAAADPTRLAAAEAGEQADIAPIDGDGGGQAEAGSGGGEPAGPDSRPPSPPVQIGFRTRPSSDRQSFKSPVVGSVAPTWIRTSFRNSSALVVATNSRSITPVAEAPEEDPAAVAVAAAGPVSGSDNSTLPLRSGQAVAQTTPTLLSMRQSLIDNRISTTSFAKVGSISPTVVKAGVDLDDVPLKEQREALLQAQQGSAAATPTMSRSASYAGNAVASSSRVSVQGPVRQFSWGAAPLAPLHPQQQNQLPGQKSQAPRKDIAMMAKWRQSTAGLHAAVPNGGGGQLNETRMDQMRNEHWQKRAEQQRNAEIESQRHRYAEQVMLSGSMNDAHRAALRRMQTQAPPDV